MSAQLKDIGQRLSALRDSFGMTAEDMAKRLDVGLGEYLSYEKGEKDFSFSFLYNAASVLGVDILDLLSGESPKLMNCSLVRRGQGYKVERDNAYEYAHLAFTFRDKKAEPFLVTVSEGGEAPTMHEHAGQEFNYILSGKFRMYIGEISYVLEPGDSFYFDSSLPHCLRLTEGGQGQFIAVVIAG